MKNKFWFKFIALTILAVSLASILEFYFSEPAYATSKKKKAKAKVSYVTAELDEAAREFVKREKIPASIVKSGEIYVMRSYTSQFKAINGRGYGAEMFSKPDTSSKVVMKLNDGAKLIADAEYTNKYGGDWYYVHYRNKAKGWVLAEYIVDRDPDENE